MGSPCDMGHPTRGLAWTSRGRFGHSRYFSAVDRAPRHSQVGIHSVVRSARSLYLLDPALLEVAICNTLYIYMFAYPVLLQSQTRDLLSLTPLEDTSDKFRQLGLTP